MKNLKAYRVALVAVVLWVAGSPVMWRMNLVATFGGIPWSQFAMPLSLAVVALLGAMPLWFLNWRLAGLVATISSAFAVVALLGSGIANGGVLLNSILLASLAAVPVIMHSNNALKRRRAKTHAP